METISLEALAKIPSIRVIITKSYFKKLLVKASYNKNPFTDITLIKKLGLHLQKRNGKLTTSYTLISLAKNTQSIPLPMLLTLIKITHTPPETFQKNIEGICFERSRSPLYFKIPLSLNFVLGNIVGHLLGDGGIDGCYSQPCYSNSNKSLLEEMQKNVIKVFNITPRIWMQRRSTFEGKTRWDRRLGSIQECEDGRNCSLFYPTSMGLILNQLLGNFAKGKKKQIPIEFMNYPQSFKQGLIRAFYDDEGTVGEKSLRIFQSNEQILARIKEMLLDLSITSANIKTYYKKGKKHYYFDIFRKTNFELFDQTIGFTSQKKAKKLKLIKRRKIKPISPSLSPLKSHATLSSSYETCQNAP